MHTAFLLSVSADSPARQKMAMWPPVAAYFACGWCLFEGFQREDDGATRFGGYADAAEQIFLELGLYKKSGCMGYSEFPRILSYMSYSDVWELPIYHASLYGIVQGFMAVLLSDYSGSDCPQHVIPKKLRSLMRERGKKMRLTAEFGRPYKCIVDLFKAYQLVDWLHFLETFSLFVLRHDILGSCKSCGTSSGNLAPSLYGNKRMLHNATWLKRALVDRSRVAAALPYVVVDDDLLAPGRTFNNDVRHQAQGNLLRCASLVEQHLPESLFTYSLHILVCRLYKQEEARGCIATCGKLGAERGIQHVKSNVKYRTTSCPEKLYVHDLLVDEALSTLQHDDATSACVRTAVKSFDELVPKYRANIRTGPLYDTRDDVTGTQLIGKGSKLKHGALTDAVQHVTQYLHRMGQRYWTEMMSGVSQQPLEICSYTMAHKRGDELMWSVAHRRARTRVSFYPKLRFITRHGSETLYIAEVQPFLRAVNGAADVLRLAVCKLYPARYGLPDMRSTEDIMTAKFQSQNAQTVLAVDVSELDTKLVTAKEGDKLYGIVYKNTSGMA
ncbi:TPA: hypothetical protein ACH3X1_004948 [Trebouxia sp. C0004]